MSQGWCTNRRVVYVNHLEVRLINPILCSIYVRFIHSFICRSDPTGRTSPSSTLGFYTLWFLCTSTLKKKKDYHYYHCWLFAGLISCFLNVHPNGATVDYLWSYLSQIVNKVRVREVEDLLDRLPCVFRQDMVGVGASLERRWVYLGFKDDWSSYLVLWKTIVLKVLN